jgi:hypothetical protein
MNVALAHSISILTALISGHGRLFKVSADIRLPDPAVVASVQTEDRWAILLRSRHLLPTKNRRFNSNPIPNCGICDMRTDLHDNASRLVSKHLWFCDEIGANTTMRIHMELSTMSQNARGKRANTDIAATDTCGFHFDENTVITDSRYGEIPNFNIHRLHQRAGSVCGRHRNL